MRKNLCVVLILLICFMSVYTYAENDTENNRKLGFTTS